MDLIVCGDALWISCGSWLSLWSGATGAFVGAVLAAGVALLVVWLTNKHQSKLSAASLDAQKTSLEVQLAEQRHEASKARELAAIADLVAATHNMWWTVDDPRGLSGLVAKSHAAAIRWRLEGTLGDSRIVENCVLSISRAVGVHSIATRSSKSTAALIEPKVLALVDTLGSFATSWPNLPAEMRQSKLASLEGETRVVDSRIEAIWAEANLPPVGGFRSETTEASAV